MLLVSERRAILDDNSIVRNDLESHSVDRNSSTPMKNEYSFIKRSVHYDIEPISEPPDQMILLIRRNENPTTNIETVLRRRHVAHWGLPG